MTDKLTEEEAQKIQTFKVETEKEKDLLRRAGISVDNRKWSIFFKISTIILGIAFLIIMSIAVVGLNNGKLQTILNQNQSINVAPAEVKIVAPVNNEYQITINNSVTTLPKPVIDLLNKCLVIMNVTT